MAETLSSLQDLGTATASPQPDAPIHVQKLDKLGRAYATGKRKDAVARVWIKPGGGRITVNEKPVETYFARPVLRMILRQPLETAGRLEQYDIVATVAGAEGRLVDRQRRAESDGRHCIDPVRVHIVQRE